MLVLGSGSPRRREILETLRVPFVVLTSSIDERVLAGETPDAYLVRIVREKHAAVAAALPPDMQGATILVADTSVIVDDAGVARVLGKPGDVGEGCAMILLLAGRSHEVHTRFLLASQGAIHEETVVTKVTFRPLTKARARAYAETGEGLDKAGGYAVQGLASAFVSRIEGSYSNVVGLPACEVMMALEARGMVHPST
jgi:septum formation protein